MHIAVGIVLAVIGFIVFFLLANFICQISTKEIREEREEYERDYVKWQEYVQKAKDRLEHPDKVEEHFSLWERMVAFFTRTNLTPSLDELNEYEWDFLKEPVKVPIYSVKRKVMVGLVGALLFGAAGYGYGISLQLLLIVALYSLLVMITFIDIDAQIIPPVFNAVIFLLGIPAIWLFPQISLIQRIIGIFCISVPMLFIVMIVPGGFGGGDIKLMAAIGFVLGVKATVAAFFIGLILGGAYGVFALVTKRRGRKEHFAFGPCLCIGIAIAVYCDWGNQLVDLYLSNFVH